MVPGHAHFIQNAGCHPCHVEYQEQQYILDKWEETVLQDQSEEQQNKCGQQEIDGSDLKRQDSTARNTQEERGGYLDGRPSRQWTPSLASL